jgi:ABC-2 type transport system ATP-binding protein
VTENLHQNSRSAPTSGTRQAAAAIECADLVCRYGDVVAVDRVSFRVERGELFGLLGPNGAGKTTTHKMLTTTVAPTAGAAWVDGLDVAREARSVRDVIGVVFQEPALDDRLTARENLELHAVLYRVRGRRIRERVQEALDWAELAEQADRRVRTFSGGMMRRVELARALLHEPSILFLDEPTVGLDPQARRRLWDQIAILRRQGLTALVMTHNMQEAESCDRVAIMDHGRLIALGTPAELKRGGAGGPAASLEDVFLQLTGRGLRDDEATSRDRLLSFARRGGELTR